MYLFPTAATTVFASIMVLLCPPFYPHSFLRYHEGDDLRQVRKGFSARYKDLIDGRGTSNNILGHLVVTKLFAEDL